MDNASCVALGEKIAARSAQIDVAFHGLLADIRLFDTERAFEVAGALTTAHWLSWRTGLTTATARERVRVARALGKLPLIDEALRAGEVSYSKVRALTRVATTATEDQLLGFAKNGTASQLERLCRQFTSVEGTMSGRPPDTERWVRSRLVGPGMVRIVAQLTANAVAGPGRRTDPHGRGAPGGWRDAVAAGGRALHRARPRRPLGRLWRADRGHPRGRDRRSRGNAPADRLRREPRARARGAAR